MPFAQVVVGAPGSGKSTFCHGMQQFLESLGRRIVLVNLDPANEHQIYRCEVDVAELVTLQKVMEDQALGPNGALLTCMEILEQRIDWLCARLSEFGDEAYFVFDLPGQVELFTCHHSLVNIIRHLEKQMHFRLAVIHLTDASHCAKPSRYIAALIQAMTCMMQLESPQVNVLSKFDLVEASGPLQYYTEVQDLHYLLLQMEDQSGKKLHGLSAALCELIQDTSMVSFVPLAVEDKECMAYLVGEIDKANGYVFGALTAGNESIFETANNPCAKEDLLDLVRERYTDEEHQINPSDDSLTE